MPNPLFSIIIPVYNRAAELRKSLASLTSQDPALFECLVQDGGSTDGTLGVLQESGSGVEWESGPDSGVYDAMNKALTRATGEFVYFLGAGDTLRPGILAAVAAVIPRGRTTFFYGQVYAEAYGRVYNGPYSKWKLSRLNICHQAVFCSRQLFERLGLFDTRYAIMADHVWNMKCFGDPGVQKVYSTLVIADYAAGGLSQQRPDPCLIEDRLALIKQYLGPVPYALNKAAALLPSGVKEARYQWFQRVKSQLRPRKKRHADRN